MDKFPSTFGRCITLGATLLLSAPVFAAEPASAASRIDPNTFIVGHPASPSWAVGRSNGEHPAVRVAARAAASSPDSNRFLVLPPTSVRWTTTPSPLVVAGVPR